MPRHVLGHASALSFLLFLATVFLWTKSYLATAWMERVSAGHVLEIGSGDGVLFIAWGTTAPAPFEPIEGWSGNFWPFIDRGIPFKRSLRSGTLIGFRYTDQFSIVGMQALEADWRELVVPYWFLALCFAILPAFDELLWCRRKRGARAGLCPACSYDLGATPERCPECGNIPIRREDRAG